MTSLDDARAVWETNKAQFQEATPTRIAYLGDGRGFAASNMIVPAAQHLNYARSSPDSKDHFVIQNRSVQPAFNKPVILGYVPHEPHIEQVLDFHYESILFNTGGSAVGQVVAHRLQHEFGGGDEVFVDPRLFTTGLGRPTNPTSGCVEVFPFAYYYKEWNRFPGVTTVDITQFTPVSGSRYVTVSVDPDTNELTYTLGEQHDESSSEFSTTAISGGPGGWGFVPSPPGNEYPLFAVNLTPTTSEINWNKDVLDNLVEARLHIAPALGDIITRIEAVEGTFGLDPSLPTVGAEGEIGGEYLANAALLRGVNILETAPTDGQSLAYSIASNSWGPSTITGGSGGSGETNTGSNVGNGLVVFREKSGVNLVFKTLAAGDNTTLASNASLITISGTDSSNAAKNLGTGLGVFHETAGASHQFKSIIPGDNITGTSNTSAITLATTDTSVAATNLGTGFGVFKETAGGSHQFKTLVAGTNITLASAASTITVTAAASPERHFNEIVSASAWNNLTVPIWQATKTSNVLLNQFNVAAMGGAAASLTFALEKRDWGTLLSGGTSVLSATQAATAGGVEAAAFNGNASILVDRQHLMLTTGSGAASGGGVDFLSITGYYTLTTASPADTNTQFLLLEIGDKLLLETGDALLLENL